MMSLRLTQNSGFTPVRGKVRVYRLLCYFERNKMRTDDEGRLIDKTAMMLIIVAVIVCRKRS